MTGCCLLRLFVWALNPYLLATVTGHFLPGHGSLICLLWKMLKSLERKSDTQSLFFQTSSQQISYFSPVRGSCYPTLQNNVCLNLTVFLLQASLYLPDFVFKTHIANISKNKSKFLKHSRKLYLTCPHYVFQGWSERSRLYVLRCFSCGAGREI